MVVVVVVVVDDDVVVVRSKLQCLHFSSWDANKEWIVDLPAGEDVRALVLGQGWAAAATSARTLRLFTVGGVQKEVFSLPGHVVSMAAHGEQLLVVYHRGRSTSATPQERRKPVPKTFRGCISDAWPET